MIITFCMIINLVFWQVTVDCIFVLTSIIDKIVKNEKRKLYRSSSEKGKFNSWTIISNSLRSYLSIKCKISSSAVKHGLSGLFTLLKYCPKTESEIFDLRNPEPCFNNCQYSFVLLTLASESFAVCFLSYWYILLDIVCIATWLIPYWSDFPQNFYFYTHSMFFKIFFVFHRTLN